jgi:hypothetical protein
MLIRRASYKLIFKTYSDLKNIIVKIDFEDFFVDDNIIMEELKIQWHELSLMLNFLKT